MNGDGPIPLVDVAAQLVELRPELEAMFSNLVREGAFVGGPTVSAFERAFAAYLGVSATVGVASGTDALVLALRALEVGPNDEVIVPAFTFVATLEAVRTVGARARLSDVDHDTALIDLESVAAMIGDRTRVILPVHLYGQMAPIEGLCALAESRGLFVVEDAAQAHGARIKGAAAGSFGHLAAFSFYPTKNLGGLGDGGAVVSRDPALTAKVRVLAAHGRSAHGVHDRVGTNSRLDAIQAGALLLRLSRLDQENEARRRIARRYESLLGGLADLHLPRVSEASAHVHHLYVVRTSARSELAAALAENSIGSGVYYPTPLHLMPAHRDLGYETGAFPRAEGWAREALALPMHPRLTERAVERIAAVVRSVFEAGR